MDCTARIANEPDGLICTRKDSHRTGHVFVASNGSHLLDRHGEEVSEN